MNTFQALIKRKHTEYPEVPERDKEIVYFMFDEDTDRKTADRHIAKDVRERIKSIWGDDPEHADFNLDDYISFDGGDSDTEYTIKVKPLSLNKWYTMIDALPKGHSKVIEIGLFMYCRLSINYPEYTPEELEALAEEYDEWLNDED